MQTWGKKRRAKPDDPPNIVRKVRPAPLTDAKALAQRRRVLAQERSKRTMAEIRKNNEKLAKKLGRDKQKTKMLKRSKGPKDGMQLLEATFKFLRQRMPVMRATLDDPAPSFLLEVYENVSKWPERVLREFLQDLTDKEPPPDVPGMIGEVKRLVHEIFDDTGLHTGEPYLARWRMWPYRKDTVEQVDPKPEKDDKENLMASKMATKKKVKADKRVGNVAQPEQAAAVTAEPTAPTKNKKAGKPEKTKSAKKSGKLHDETKLKPGANMPTKGIYGQLLPLIPKSGITLAALTKAAAAKIKFGAAKVRRYAAGAIREGYATAE